MFAFHAADIPEEEARYWAKKLEQLNAMRDQDVSSLSLHHFLSVFTYLFVLFLKQQPVLLYTYVFFLPYVVYFFIFFLQFAFTQCFIYLTNLFLFLSTTF